MQDVAMSVAEYLTGDFEVDLDYVDGQVEERNVGEMDHSRWQLALVLWFAQHKQEWGLVGFPELRLKVSATRYRVPDVCVFAQDQRPSEPVPSVAPLAVFEILSAEDRFERVLVRLADFGRMGVRNIFLVASEHVFYRFENGGLFTIATEQSELEGSPAYVAWGELAKLRF